jgi:DNA-binding SARP family transcriptional activator
LCGALHLGPEEARELKESARRERHPPSRAATGEGPHTPLRVEVLGTLAVWIAGKQITVRSRPQQAVLGLLAIDHGKPVPLESILELLRGEHPNHIARDAVQSRVSQLRRTLQIGEYQDSVERTLAWGSGGYRLQVGAEELDLSAFRRLAGQADVARRANFIGGACKLYGQAFELCRGEPCANVDMLKNHPSVTKLRRELTEVLMRYAEVAAELGRHSLVVRHLEAFAARDRLNERVHASLMIALAGSGEQARAIQVYEDLRSRLKDDLGIDPGPGLSAAHLRVLRQEVFAVSAPQIRTVVGAAHLIPRQLPNVPYYLCGREDELTNLNALLDEHVGTPSPTVAAVTGMGGIGKTALAVYWAGQVADRFPDGQLYADMRGFAPSGSPASPTEVVQRFLAAFGVPDAEMPSDFDSQITLLRSVLAAKKVLVMLDNARNAEQVRPVLPGTSGCFVLVTSRNRLTGLVASPGARPLPLDPLTEEHSRMLFAHALGEEPVANEACAVHDIVNLCGGIPLALCNAVAQAAARPQAPLAEMATAMRDEYGLLDALETRDETTSMRAVFSWSQAKLATRAERMFRFLCVHPGSDVTVATAASLAGVSLREAYLLLADLADECLVTEHQLGRYTYHPLLRAYAAEILQDRESEAERRAGTHRLIDHYLHSVIAAWGRIVPSRRPPLVQPLLRDVVPLRFCSASEAESWLLAERRVLLTLMELAAEGEFTPHVWELPSVAFPLLEGSVSSRAMLDALDRALATAQKLDDIDGQLTAHEHLAGLLSQEGACAQADQHLSEVFALARQLHGECSAGLARLRAGGTSHVGLEEAEQALQMYRDVEDLEGRLRILRLVRWFLVHHGDRAGAEEFRSQIQELRGASKPPSLPLCDKSVLLLAMFIC